DVFETFVTEVGLTDENAVAVFRERPITAAGIITERDVARARIRPGFQTDTEKPIIRQNPAESEAQTVTGQISLLGIFAIGLAVANFVTDPRVAVEFELGDRCRQFPFTGRRRR